MKIKSLLSVIACGVVSQIMIGCNSSKQFYDFGLPSTAYHKVAPQPVEEIPVAEETTNTPVVTVAPEETTVATIQPQPELEANAAAPKASGKVARKAPLTTQAVEEALATAKPEVKNLVNELSEAKSKKEIRKITKKMKRDAKATNKANAINSYMKIGIVLILAGVLLSVLPGLGLVGSIVAVVGVVFLVLGLLEML
ncbi:hypothetical protein [Rufibacter roseus]|uniref:Uncharacterized protein n=1 Tax=Rufibacter roseus TaxID=1567108 RepID=A0ABW2DNF8_9BACT|nr:hypothetical protein [Rufibacter roseus]